MKKFWEVFWQVFAVLCIIAFIGSGVWAVEYTYQEYLTEYEEAPSEVVLNVQSVSIARDGSFKIVVEGGEHYYTQTLMFDEDIEGIQLVLEKKEEMNRWQVMAKMLGMQSQSTWLYTTTLYLELDWDGVN